MAQPQWTRLDREQAHKVLRHLGDRGDAIVFSQDMTEVSWRSLPFYTNYRLYRLVNYATMPTFTMTYLGSGEEYLAVDGTAGPIYTVNEKDPLRLNEMNVIPYLEFFFSSVQGSEGDVFLIKDPRKLSFMDTLTQAQQQSIVGSFRPLEVSANTANGSYRVSGTLHYGGALIAATMGITHDGKISFQEQHLLLSGIHFPGSPYSGAWDQSAFMS